MPGCYSYNLRATLELYPNRPCPYTLLFLPVYSQVILEEAPSVSGKTEETSQLLV